MANGAARHVSCDNNQRRRRTRCGCLSVMQVKIETSVHPLLIGGRIWRLRLAGQVPGVRDGQLLPGRAHNRDAAEFRRASSSATPTTCMPGRCAPWRAWIDEAPLASAARTRPAGRETLEARPSTFWRPPGPIWNARASRQLGWQSRKCNRAEPRYELRVPMVTVLVQGMLLDPGCAAWDGALTERQVKTRRDETRR